jgi:hypothetical protein
MKLMLAQLAIAVAALAGVTGAAHGGGSAESFVPTTPIGTVRDFDGQHGRWHTSVRRLIKPLEGSNEWAEYEGSGMVHPLVGGQANVAELDVSGPKGRIQGVSVRLFDPKAKRWTSRFANLAGGVLDDGIVGGFAGGTHGVFYGSDTFNGRQIIVRFEVDVVDDRTVKFEQAFSADGGKSWEVNWQAVDRRV